MILGIQMSKVKIAVLESQVERLLEKQKELTERVRANEKVVAAIGLFGSVAVAFIGAGYFAPSAEACSPRLDGEPTYCPDFDDVVLRDPPVQEEEDDEPRYIKDWNTRTITFIDTREDKPFVIMDTYNHMINKLRNWKSEKERTPAEDSINNALANLEWNYGSDETAKQEELLQLPSDGD